MDAVEAAVACMEDNPTFDAGKGSVLNHIGEVEMDAVIMDGRSLRSGAVAAIRHVSNPVRVARKVMDETSFSMLVGEGAFQFAMVEGFPECTEEELLVGRELEDYREFLRTGVLRTREHFSGEGRDTVGACAMDSERHFAAATSTGGIPRKIKGRVGDSPIVGCGAYADDQMGAASATGWGEKIVAVVLSKSALDILGSCQSPVDACERAISLMKDRVDGLGGIIMIDREGRAGYHHNTPRMAFASIERDGLSKMSGVSRNDSR